MSEASRSTALAHAIAVHKDGDADTVLATAERFHAYMTDASPAEPKPAKVAAEGVKFVSVTLPKQQRATKVVKDTPPEEIAREIVEWISKG